MIALSFTGEFTVKNAQDKQLVLVFSQWESGVFYFSARKKYSTEKKKSRCLLHNMGNNLINLACCAEG